MDARLYLNRRRQPEGSAVDPLDDDRSLTLSEVAALFGVAPQSVGRWAQAGLVPYSKTPGGERRFRQGDIRRLLERRA
jgi:hypothetical protein